VRKGGSQGGKIGFAGGGRMAEAIIRGLNSVGGWRILVFDPSRQRRDLLRKRYRVEAMRSNGELIHASDILVIAVKPAYVQAVCGEIAGGVGGKLVVSIAAGIPRALIKDLLGTERVVRTMPNTPALAGKGVTVVASAPGVARGDVETVKGIFSHVGDVLVMEEKYLDAVTALSGSGPAFVSLFVEALVDGAVRLGIRRDDALRLALGTVEGTIAMLGEGLHTAEVREMVTSPGGTTAEGLAVLESKGFKGIVKEALRAACEKATGLGR